MGETPEPEAREAEWLAEQPLEEVPEGLTEEEIQKKDEEKQKVAEAETEESTTVAKRKGYRMFIYGKDFLKANSEIVAKFCWDGQIVKTNTCVYKNSCMLATHIPDMGADVPEGEHLISVEVSLNGQQFSS